MPAVGDFVLICCLVVAVLAGRVMISADGDPSRHQVVGEMILRTGAIPRVDVFSHTMAGEPFVPYEWLAEVASAAAYRVAGWAGPVLLHGAAIGLTFALLWRHLRQRGHPFLLSIGVTLLALWVSRVHWLARPHVFTFLGTAIFAMVLDGWQAGRLGRKWLWLLAVVTAVWANLHGGFLVGLLLLWTYAAADVMRALSGTPEVSGPARRRLRDLAAPTLGTLAATLCTPAGTGLLPHVTSYFGMRLLVDRTQEYMSPNFHQHHLLPYVGMVLLIVAGLAWSRRRPPLHETLLFGGFLYLSLFAGRNIPLFAILTAPLLAAQLQALTLPALPGGRMAAVGSRLGTLLVQRDAAYGAIDARTRGHLWPVVVVLVLGLAGWVDHRAGQAPLGIEIAAERLPVQAASYLAANPPPGNGFNELHWGGYLLHRLWPAQQVFIDGQTDFYGEALAREYFDVTELRGNPERILQARGVRWVVYSTGSPLVVYLLSRPDWRVAYVDQVATVLVRVEANR
jgi:hypothetical protein